MKEGEQKNVVIPKEVLDSKRAERKAKLKHTKESDITRAGYQGEMLDLPAIAYKESHVKLEKVLSQLESNFRDIETAKDVRRLIEDAKNVLEDSHDAYVKFLEKENVTDKESDELALNLLGFVDSIEDYIGSIRHALEEHSDE